MENYEEAHVNELNVIIKIKNMDVSFLNVMSINKRKWRMRYKTWPNFYKLKIYLYKINIPNFQEHK